MAKKLIPIVLVLALVLSFAVPSANAQGVKVTKGYTSAFLEQKDGSWHPIVSKLKGDVFDVHVSFRRTIKVNGKSVKGYVVKGTDWVVPVDTVKKVRSKTVTAKRDTILYDYKGEKLKKVKKGEKFVAYGKKHFGVHWVNGYRVFYGAGYYNGYLPVKDMK